MELGHCIVHTVDLLEGEGPNTEGGGVAARVLGGGCADVAALSVDLGWGPCECSCQSRTGKGL